MIKHVFVSDLPDLIAPTEYPSDPKGKRVRLRIYVTENGIEAFGDAMRAQELEKLFEELMPDTIERMLCG